MFAVLVVFALFFPLAALAEEKQAELMIFAGSASAPALKEVAAAFELEKGIRVYLNFGGSGAMLSQMELTRRGDVFFPGSSDFMELAKKKGLVKPETEIRVAYLLPAISVRKGNPKGIRGLADLAKPGLRIAIARPESVCVGLYGVEVLEGVKLLEEVKKNLVTSVESCERTAQVVSLGFVDAALGWDVFSEWDPAGIETVRLKPQEVRRIGYLPAAASVFSKSPEAAKAFLDYLAGPSSLAVFKRKGYITDLLEARKFTLPDTPVGGEYPLPESWLK